MCPACGEPLIVIELDGIEVDRCVSCGGTWVDAGEIEMLGGPDPASMDRISRELASGVGNRRTSRRCPRCPRRLREVVFARAGGGIRIDRCPWGHGVWFDHGEMRSLIDSDPGEALAAPARFFSELYPSEVAGRDREGS